jgi:predicted RNase H-like HicB family nuclease
VTLRIGIVGAGLWAQRAHLPAFQHLPDVEVRAIADPDVARAQELARQFGVPRAVADHRSVLDAGVDALAIVAPDDVHHDVASAALAAGLPVLCEKPLARTVEETADPVARAAAARVATKLGFVFRYSPALRRLRELVHEGYVGRPHTLIVYSQNPPGGHLATSPSLPGCSGQGDTIDGVLDNIPGAIELCLEEMQALAEVIPDPSRVLSEASSSPDGFPASRRFGREAIRVFERLGYSVGRQRGSHFRLRHATGPSREPVTSRSTALSNRVAAAPDARAELPSSSVGRRPERQDRIGAPRSSGCRGDTGTTRADHAQPAPRSGSGRRCG